MRLRQSSVKPEVNVFRTGRTGTLAWKCPCQGRDVDNRKVKLHAVGGTWMDAMVEVLRSVCGHFIECCGKYSPDDNKWRVREAQAYLEEAVALQSTPERLPENVEAYCWNTRMRQLAVGGVHPLIAKGFVS